MALVPPEKFQTLIGMTATYVRSPSFVAMIHEVQGNYALVQYQPEGTWQLVSLEKIEECSLEPPGVAT